MKKNIISLAAYILTALPLWGVGGGLLAACSDDDFCGDPEKDWSGTSTFFASVDAQGFGTYFTPAVGRVGDPMPFYDQQSGDFKVLYLQEFDNNMSHRFHPIWAVSTKDGAHYESLGEIIPFGTNDYQQDAALGTGCAYEKDGTYYVYYTGHNGNCNNREVVMRATSSDFKTWTKDELWALNGPDFGYSGNDFRDPQIFVADDGLYHMLISTYPVNGGDPVFAEFKSGDLQSWEHVGRIRMIWDRMLECPDVFKMGDYWYLVYSESFRASWSRKVKYMMAPTFDELKRCFNDGPKWPADGHEGVLDSRAFYAGKTASNGTDRYIWGWCPFRSGADLHEKNVNVGAGDGNEPNWSGALICHKLIQHADGTLTLGAVPAMAAKYHQEQPLTVMASNGATLSGDNRGATLSGDDAYVLYNRLGTCNHITFTVKTSNNWDKFGISFVRGTDSKKYYTIVVNPEDENHRKVNFEQEGEEGKGFIEAADGYWFERPADNIYSIDIYTDNSVLVMYVRSTSGRSQGENDVCTYTQRIYGIQKNCWSVNNYGGSVTVSDVHVSQQ
ncbi:MAG: glycoside hydrolase domain-containing protein [Prevotella sp.]